MDETHADAAACRALHPEKLAGQRTRSHPSAGVIFDDGTRHAERSCSEPPLSARC